MFEQPTVIITGAGSSMEYGLPSGKEIFEALRLEARAHYQNLQSQSASSLIRLRVEDSFLPLESFSFAYFMSTLNDTETTLLQSQLLRINETIDSQFDNSIDEYIYNNMTYSRIGKLLSIWRLYASLYQEAWDMERNTKILSKRSDHMFSIQSYENSDRSWLASLAHKITKGCETVEDLKKNKLSILTFNYDTFIEQGLLALIRGSERFRKLENLDFIEIIHINGKLNSSEVFDIYSSDYNAQPFVDLSVFKEMESNTRNIYMVNESVSPVTLRDRRKAANSISLANKIFVLGFAFDPNNVEILTLDKLNNNQSLYALNYDGDIQLTNRIKSVGANKNTIVGSDTNRIGCARAALKGFFDQ